MGEIHQDCLWQVVAQSFWGTDYSMQTKPPKNFSVLAPPPGAILI